MPHFRNRPFAYAALIGVFAAALTLAGCGRKGALDSPPSAAAAGEQSAAATAAAAGQPQQGGSLSPIGQFSAGHTPNPDTEGGVDSQGRAIAPKRVPEKKIPLDSLLN